MSRRELLLKRIKDISPVRIIVSSFVIIIVIGGVLLTLPVSARNGQTTPFINALFTSTSATCVTGLAVYDSWTHWSAFGQVIILGLIQLGGLGLVAFTTGFTLFMHHKLGLRDMQLASEYTSGNLMDIPRLMRTILIWTFACEAAGALLLMLRFVPKFGLYGIWVSVFLSVSSYCNAGFDILGFETPDVSLQNYVNDPLVCLPICALIIIGGIGFIVISDIHAWGMKKYSKEEKHPHLTLHTRIVLITTATLLVIGTALVFVFEYNNTLADMTIFQKIHASFFQSTTARTAGFASVNQGDLLDITKIVTIFLMFIGASPSSTGGGIKTTTFVVLIGTVLSVLRGQDETILQRRRVDKSVVYRSLAILFLSTLVVLTTTSVLLLMENDTKSAISLLFETVSAFATVGLSTGITPLLSSISIAALIITMFIGRVGPISLVLALTMSRSRRAVMIRPEGRVIVG